MPHEAWPCQRVTEAAHQLSARLPASEAPRAASESRAVRFENCDQLGKAAAEAATAQRSRLLRAERQPSPSQIIDTVPATSIERPLR